MDVNKIIQQQSERISELEKENKLLKKKSSLSKDNKYSFSKATVDKITSKNGELNKKIEQYRALMIELYIVITDNPVKVKEIIKKKSDIEYLTPEVKNIAYTIRAGEK